MAYPSRRPRATSPLVGLVVLAVVASACGEPDLEALPPAPPSTTVPPITVPGPIPDTRSVGLDPVGGTGPAEAPVALHGGSADLAGVVTGPDGPVAGATVRVERFEGTRSASLEVKTGSDGRYRVERVHGGRYRARAWSAPRLGMTASVLSFVPDGRENEIDLALSVQDGIDVQAVAGATAIPLGGQVTVTALVTRRAVDGEGIISAQPARTARATLAAPSGWEPDRPEEQAVDGDGRVAWTLTCSAPGTFTATVRAEGVVRDVTLTCRPPADRPRDDAPRPESELDVGDQFSPPFDAVVPAGDYRVVDHSGTCGLSYQRWSDGAWEPTRRTVVGTGDFTLELPGRDLRTIGDTPPCLYERVA